MSIFSRRLKQATLAALTLSSFGAVQSAYAEGTAADTDIVNQAVVSYSVGGVTQPDIPSSPGGNSSPTGGAPTTFKVDRRIFMDVADVVDSTAAAPGQTNVVRAFVVTNTSNAPLGFSLAAANVSTGDDFDVTIVGTYIDAASASSTGYTPGTYDTGDAAGTTIATLPVDHSITVFVLATMPVDANDTEDAQITLTATAIEPTGSTFGSAGSVVVADAGANTDGVETVFGNTTGVESDTNVYSIESAELTVAKTATVISDDFNGTTNPKAIPGAVVEYEIEIENGGSAPATDVSLDDALASTVTFELGAVSGSDIEISVTGLGTPATCTVAADADDCSLTGTTLAIGPGAIPDIPGNGTATVRFRVTIN